MLYASDGPYTADHLREKIVGTVVGILAPRRHPRGNDEGGSPEASAPTAPATDALTPGSEEAKAAFKDACHQHTIRTQFADEYPVKSQELETDGAVPILAAIEAHAVARTAFCATVNAQDHAGVRQNGGDASDEVMAPAHAAAREGPGPMTYSDEIRRKVEAATRAALPTVTALLWRAPRAKGR